MMILVLLKQLNWSQYQAQTATSPARTDEDPFSYNWANLSMVGGLLGKTVAIVGMGEINHLPGDAHVDYL